MIRVGWGRDNPAVRQMFTTLYMPDAPAESQRWFSDLQRKTTSAANAAATLECHGDVDIRDVLGRSRRRRWSFIRGTTAACRSNRARNSRPESRAPASRCSTPPITSFPQRTRHGSAAPA